ncbi:MAG: 1-deoxy-D-xylulose-5-phosphate reductoisomerase [Armatimonadota bacterium]|nr:1-deoxy-D-xylulose-5-phosphate reductoisomerase [bacterium]MDW8320335.1 1-deoxy-D-xylulose-5-phosphate reductoisomerase [Armatimonadota bacterium]
MKRIALLGSTGSIGTQCLDVAARLPEHIQVVALAAHRDHERLWQQAQRFGVQHVALKDESSAASLRERQPDWHVYTGDEGLQAIATLPEVDMVVVGVAGVCGLAATVAALRAGKSIALASKEVLVAAGESVMSLAKERGLSVVPIDSEHSAVFQCLQGERIEAVNRILLTASGGALRDVPLEQLPSVNPERALQHPTWRMGAKITIDSATLMNKGLEIIEAHWLFGVPADRVQVVLHPQSIVHALVEMRDGSVLAQLGLPDMRLPIQYALLYPERVDTRLPRLDLTQVGCLTFSEPDPRRYPALQVARDALAAGGTMPAAMNAANEVAVARFLKGEIRFTDIVQCVRDVMEKHTPQPAALEAVQHVDTWAREQARLWKSP